MQPEDATLFPGHGTSPLGVSSRSLCLDEAAFLRIADLVRAEAGIKLSESKSNLIVSRLGRRVKALKLLDFHNYLDFVSSEKGGNERRQMLSLLTTNVTRFFREPHHFDALRTTVLPLLIAKARSGASVRIWSAGCSIGAEPLSIGIELLRLCPDAQDLDIRILASDLDPNSLQTASEALYVDAEIARMPKDIASHYFEPADCGRGKRAVAKLRDLITYAELNLVGPWPMERRFDVIFCRNVVIYFDKATQTELWPRFADALLPGGMLFIGHSERLSGAGEARFEPAGITQYRRI
ncbi:MAG: protein-glutamate O-methyltransferase [Pseudomonadota bacterium]